MFEPGHGSAPDIVGKGIANPIGQIWTAKMMIDHMGYQELGDLLFETIEETIHEGIKTPDLGGKSSTEEVARKRIIKFLVRVAVKKYEFITLNRVLRQFTSS